MFYLAPRRTINYKIYFFYNVTEGIRDDENP